ncbi:hypothetical protein FHT32_004492 [Variovorax sp. SG517]|uniref:hypothetical protein n=1 Tax=Variovorax sp. SG517 TaxID=2587117 RepID=UPI00159E6AAE|nr:hypothetical protein [Variovorax sp. SG517]NVM90835.1 hypothetical protein [Variovorax sp. SG517]
MTLKTHFEKLTAIRAQRVAKLAERATIEQFELSRHEAVAKVRATLVAHEERGARAARHAWSNVLTGSHGQFFTVHVDRTVSLGDLLVPLLGVDAVLSALTRHFDDGDDLAKPERAARLAAFDAELLQLERAEEALIREVEAAGGLALRRANANPVVVLDVEVSA